MSDEQTAPNTTITIDLAMDDLMAFTNYHYAHSPHIRRMTRWVQLGCVLAFAAIGGLLATRAGSLGLFAELLLGAGFGLMVALFFPWTQKRQLRSSAKKMYQEGGNQGVLCAHTLELTDDGLLEKTDVNETLTRWGGIERIGRTEDYAFIYISAVSALPVPLSGPEAAEHQAFIAELERRQAAATPLG